MDQLNTFILRDIFLFFIRRTGDLYNFSLVCKSWNNSVKLVSAVISENIKEQGNLYFRKGDHLFAIEV